MKKVVLLFLVAIGLRCQAQYTEFKESTKGLIYPDSTMNLLKNIVDSLNLKFKVCDMNKVFYARPQTRAHYISFTNKHADDAKRDMEDNISFEAFIEKYPSAHVSKDELVTKMKYSNEDGIAKIEYASIGLNHGSGNEIEVYANDRCNYGSQKGKWIFNYNRKEKYLDERVVGFYFLEDFVSDPIPIEYSNLIQYGECLIDSNTEVMLTKPNYNYQAHDGNTDLNAIDRLMVFVQEKTKKPSYPASDSDSAYAEYETRFDEWQTQRFRILDSIHLHDQSFKTALSKAVEYALKNNESGEEFEEYVGRYYSLKTELQLKRSRYVIGGCSMDSRPRMHALAIAELAANTVNWEVFLRSHLNIMNDRFARMSDGSYAWKNRKTYIKELEELNINVLDLLIGISMRAEGVCKNHYYATIYRVGRALSESKDADLFQEQVLKMIEDQRLDTYNRIVMYYLFLNYNDNLTDELKQKQNEVRLNLAYHTFPAYLQTKQSEEK